MTPPRPADDARWIPRAFIAGALGLIAIQAGFAYLAIRSDPGLSTPNAYERGLAHNAVLREAAAEKSLHWRVEVENRGDGAHRGTLTVAATDARAQPLDGLAVSALVVRPASAGFDRRLEFVPAGAGRYRAVYDLPLPGLWELDLLLERGGARDQQAIRFSAP